MTPQLQKILTKVKDDIKSEFNQYCPIPLTSLAYSPVINAMRYSFLAGGKRIRPALALAWTEALGGSCSQSLKFGLALECVHTYSLIQDDLPCMDDDTLRRNQPTCHIQFNEHTAILASDGLNTLASQIIISMDVSAELKLQLIQLLCEASGVHGMVGGQMWDMLSEGQHALPLNQSELHNLQSMKTGAIITAACVGGALIAGVHKSSQKSAHDYGQALGALFQVTDDLLDNRPDLNLGKTAGKDAAQNKQTTISFMGHAAAEAYADELLKTALATLNNIDSSAQLSDLAHFIRYRQK